MLVDVGVALGVGVLTTGPVPVDRPNALTFTVSSVPENPSVAA